MFWTFFCDMFRLVMKQDSSTFVRWRGVILVMAMTAVVLVEPAYCKTNSPVLLLHQSPQEGGTLTPDVGIHHLALNTSVTLTAIPRPGYQFVCWLGDVGDPTANSTTLYLDAPKIVVAVFELAEYDLLPMEGGPKSAPAGGLLASAADYAGQGGFGGPGGRRPRTFRLPEQSEPSEPEEQDEFPVPAPEPSTGVLLVAGSLFVFARRRTRR
ncbi:MAG: InlB B-repeat-containing protein [Planctomycetota bacterium]